MEIIKTWYQYFFYPSGEEATKIVEANLKKRDTFQKLEYEHGRIDVCILPSCAQYVVKFGDPLRAKVGASYRKVIEEHSLYLLEVPKSWPFSKGVVAEKKELYSYSETKALFLKMSQEERAPYLAQFWTFVLHSKFSDIRENVALEKKMFGVARLVIFDTEPTTPRKEAERITNFTFQAPFPQEEIFDQYKATKGLIASIYKY